MMELTKPKNIFCDSSLTWTTVDTEVLAREEAESGFTDFCWADQSRATVTFQVKLEVKG